MFNLYLDADGDGFGDPEISTMACKSTVGYVDNGDDCDDTDPRILSPPLKFTKIPAGSTMMVMFAVG